MPMDPHAFESQPYTRKAGKGLTYTLFANRMGAWRIELDGRVLKTAGEQDWFGKPRWGSKKLQAEAFEAAKASVERFLTDDG